MTPTPSQTMSQLVFTPAGTVSVFGFRTPVPYPFGDERTGDLVTDMDAAVKSAKAHGADVTVATFPDPIGRDAIIEWPGGVRMQRNWHTQVPQYDALQTIPENRVYVSPERADALVRNFVWVSHGKVVSDERTAPGVEIGRPDDTYRRVRIESGFGKMTVLATDGHLPYPLFGREMTGYEVADLAATLDKAKAAGATVLVQPFTSDKREAALVGVPVVISPRFIRWPINVCVPRELTLRSISDWISAMKPEDNLLAAIAGYVDTLSFVALFGLFTAHVTGNFVLIGADVAGFGQGIFMKLMAFPAFIVGVVLSSALVKIARPKGANRSAAVLYSAQAALLLAFCVFCIAAQPVASAAGVPVVVCGMLGAAAMGVHISAHERPIARAGVPNTVMTGNVTQAGA